MSKRLVILAPNWLGDAVMALPAIADVRRAMPDAAITVAARPSVAPLFALVPEVDDHVDSAQIAGADIALLFPNAFRTALLAWRAGVPERWGYRTDGRGLLLTRGVDRPTQSVHQVDYYRHLIAGLGFATGTDAPRIIVGDAPREDACALLVASGWDGRSPLVAIAPGAAYGGAKRWPAERFAELAASLARDGVQTVMVGSAADVATATVVAQAFTPAVDLVAKTNLPTLAGVFTHCRTLVTNDSGAMHLAAAVGLPVTAVFGPTRDAETRPRGDAHAVITNPVWCRPCMLRECPLDHRCLRTIDAATVVAAARRTL
ncbi:MAG TPA: lipopolysaccharide heptosyltransferase II [Vicinamibacterales bacterium]|nr:lipopolysaccharide heptosyltransferase II [Vicinamibacterales bacterium]